MDKGARDRQREAEGMSAKVTCQPPCTYRRGGVGVMAARHGDG